jgi:type II secretory pathway pseudopilin PulG
MPKVKDTTFMVSPEPAAAPECKTAQRRTPAASARSRLDDRGYILVVLLAGMAVTAVWMGAMLPAWRQQSMREKEIEMIFRGEQYARAIAIFYQKNGTFPPTIDILVQQKYLRKKWKDPITGEDFLPMYANQATGSPPGGQPQSGIIGVYSKSTAPSIRIYQNQQAHNLWQFTWQTGYQLMNLQPPRQGGPGNLPRGGGPPGTGRPGPGADVPSPRGAPIPGDFRLGPGDRGRGPGGGPQPPVRGGGGPGGVPPGRGRG